MTTVSYNGPFENLHATLYYFLYTLILLIQLPVTMKTVPSKDFKIYYVDLNAKLNSKFKRQIVNAFSTITNSLEPGQLNRYNAHPTG